MRLGGVNDKQGAGKGDRQCNGDDRGRHAPRPDTDLAQRQAGADRCQSSQRQAHDEFGGGNEERPEKGDRGEKAEEHVQSHVQPVGGAAGMVQCQDAERHPAAQGAQAEEDAQRVRPAAFDPGFPERSGRRGSGWRGARRQTPLAPR